MCLIKKKKKKKKKKNKVGLEKLKTTNKQKKVFLMLLFEEIKHEQNVANDVTTVTLEILKLALVP